MGIGVGFHPGGDGLAAGEWTRHGEGFAVGVLVGIAIGVDVGVGEALGVGTSVAATLKHIRCQLPVECVSVIIMTAARTIQVRPSQNRRWQKHSGWEVYEGDGVCPVYVGPTAREQALSYAHQRGAYAPTEIRVLDNAWNVIEVISPRNTRGLA